MVLSFSPGGGRRVLARGLGISRAPSKLAPETTPGDSSSPRPPDGRSLFWLSTCLVHVFEVKCPFFFFNTFATFSIT